ncbi:MAG: cell division protein FtsZ [Mycoplasmatales bacterium]|nr:cell division protein FtsZ [Mycoplasmatales bacterium]
MPTEQKKKTASSFNFTISKKDPQKWSVKRTKVDGYKYFKTKSEAFQATESLIKKTKGATGRIKIYEDKKYTSSWLVESGKETTLTSGQKDAEILKLFKKTEKKPTTTKSKKTTSVKKTTTQKSNAKQTTKKKTEPKSTTKKTATTKSTTKKATVKKVDSKKIDDPAKKTTPVKKSVTKKTEPTPVKKTTTKKTEKVIIEKLPNRRTVLSNDPNNKQLENTLVNIKVIGVGGGGNNAMQDVYDKGISGVDFILANTDEQDLIKNMEVTQVIKLGRFNDRGLGAGANPNVGRDVTLESEDVIKEALKGADMVIVVAGMGGGTGTGASPVIAKFARELGALTLGVVTTPFKTEGELKQRNTKEGLKELRQNTDSLITISNEKLNKQFGGRTLQDAFKVSNTIIHQIIKMLSDLVNKVSLINIDFADVTRIIKDQGTAIAGVGVIHDGENKTVRAAAAAATNPILESSLSSAKSALVSVSGSSSLTLDEVNEAIKTIQYLSNKNTDIIFGVTIDESLEDDVIVSVLATGINKIEDLKNKFSEKWAKKVAKKVRKLSKEVD